ALHAPERAKEGLLHGILGFEGRGEHPIAIRRQLGAMLVELVSDVTVARADGCFHRGVQWYERSEIIVAFPLGSGQAVRLLTLDQVIGGSNPPSPASSGAGHASGLRSPDLDLGQRSDARMGVVKIPRIERIRWG